MKNQRQLSNPITLRVPADILAEIEEIADVCERTRSWVFVRALKSYLATEGREVLRSQRLAGKWQTAKHTILMMSSAKWRRPSKGLLLERVRLSAGARAYIKSEAQYLKDRSPTAALRFIDDLNRLRINLLHSPRWVFGAMNCQFPAFYDLRWEIISSITKLPVTS